MRSSILWICAAYCAVFALPNLAQAQALPRGSSYQSSTTAPARAGSIQARSMPVPTESFPTDTPDAVIAAPQPIKAVSHAPYTVPQAVTAAPLPSHAAPPQRAQAKPNHHDWKRLYGQEVACRQCNLPQHFPYEAENFSYYFRPYEYNEIAPQQAFQPGMEKNPYDNRFFLAIYNQYPMMKSVPEPIR